MKKHTRSSRRRATHSPAHLSAARLAIEPHARRRAQHTPRDHRRPRPASPAAHDAHDASRSLIGTRSPRAIITRQRTHTRPHDRAAAPKHPSRRASAQHRNQGHRPAERLSPHFTQAPPRAHPISHGNTPRNTDLHPNKPTFVPASCRARQSTGPDAHPPGSPTPAQPFHRRAATRRLTTRTRHDQPRARRAYPAAQRRP
jgi:hypothetical protein